MTSRLVSWSLIGALVLLASSAFPLVRIAAGKEPALPREQGHWAFQPIRRPNLPSVKKGDSSWVRNAIDAFVLNRAQAAGLKPAPPADRRTLLRRVYLDLIGLPPTPEEQQSFLQDRSPRAFEKVVDGLLSRPQYGERWARHWLDVVRYAESNGYERDGNRPSAWRYRDYVIQAFNQDKPYDRFVTEQLAGDEIDGADADTRIATTFLRLGTWDDEPADPLVDRYDQLDDVLGTTATAFLGLTLQCARCHDHKFEPFTQADYYRMLAVFEPLKRPQNGRQDLDRPVGTEAELAAFRAAMARADAEVGDRKKNIEEVKKRVCDRLLKGAGAILALHDRQDGKAGTGREKRVSDIPPEALAAFQTDPGRRTPLQKNLLKKFATQLDQAIRQAATVEEKSRMERWEKEISAIDAGRPKLPAAYIWYEEGPKAPASHIFRRGNPRRPRKAVVQPGLPAILVHEEIPPPQPRAKSSGRRLWLARWLTCPDNPLVARVMANRLWQHHFGVGLVASANDFGLMGDRPSNRELLDWLAAEFMANGWRMKPLHRLMVLSNTYQMSSSRPPGGHAASAGDVRSRKKASDPVISRWRQRRLEAEAVRDSILAVSGRLNLQMGGPSFFPPLPRAVLEGQSRPGMGWGQSDEQQANRRSIYIFAKRSLAVPELELLDAPDTTSSCERRSVSTTGPQALTFLNGAFMQQQARYFAARLERETRGGPRAQVKRAFELALCRPPRPEEMQLAIDFLTSQQRQIEEDAKKMHTDCPDARQRALESFCLVILNTNEFAYLN